MLRSSGRVLRMSGVTNRLMGLFSSSSPSAQRVVDTAGSVPKRQCVAHPGTTLDQVVEFLTDFSREFPACEGHVTKTVGLLEQYLGPATEASKQADRFWNPNPPEDPNVSIIPSDPIGDPNTSLPIDSNEPIKMGGVTLGYRNMDLLNVAQKANKRGISTSAAQNAKIELVKAKPNPWSTEPANENPHGAAITLSAEQNNVVELARLGYNIFYTGSAGTGKSLLLKSLIRNLKEQHGMGTVGVTASTGIAACNIGGVTLHSYTGIGLGEGTKENLLKKVRRNAKARERWKDLEVLIIDEISMINGVLLDKLAYVAQKIRRSGEPFGGIQVILCGDFFQLPPVNKNKDVPTVFAFESEAWKKTIQFTITLKQVFRQKGDRDFANMLNEIREGRVTAATQRKFKALQRPLRTVAGVVPAELYPTRRQVEEANKVRLDNIPGNPVTFTAVEGGSIRDKEQRRKLLDNFLAPREITLKKGAQVMMVKNIDERLVNGSLGKVVDFIDPATYTYYKGEAADPTKDDKPEKPPLELIRNQETCEDELDESVFSFMKDIDMDTASESVKESLRHKQEVLHTLYSQSKGKRLPLVRFILSDGSTREVLVEAEDFNVEDEFDNPLVSRHQIPLILAWSLSIHKSQGQTLPLVKVDLGKVFEKGQAYVALSRAMARNGLEVHNFNPAKIMAHPKVIKFYDTLMDTEEAMKKADGMKEKEKGIGQRLGSRKDDSFNSKVDSLREGTASVMSFPELASDEPEVPEDVQMMG